MYPAGEKPGEGTYVCTMCSLEIVLENDDDELPICPDCKAIFYNEVI